MRANAGVQILAARKVEGIMACAELLVVALMDKREPFVFGRRTMPEMDLVSVSCAIQNFWLAARAEGIGVGWVSLFDFQRLRELCNMPDGSAPIAVLCVGQCRTVLSISHARGRGLGQAPAVGRHHV